MAQPDTRRLLGGRDPREFLARFWHKEPLLVRDAAPRYRDAVSPERLFALATRDAHGLYAKYGFTALAAPGSWMEVYRRDIYTAGVKDSAP